MTNPPDWRQMLASLTGTLAALTGVAYKDVIQDLLDMGMSVNQQAAEMDVDHRAVRFWRDGTWTPSPLNALKLLALREQVRANQGLAAST